MLSLSLLALQHTGEAAPGAHHGNQSGRGEGLLAVIYSCLHNTVCVQYITGNNFKFAQLVLKQLQMAQILDSGQNYDSTMYSGRCLVSFPFLFICL